MVKKQSGWGNNTASQVVLAAGAPEAHQMFGGKTLAQIGAAFDLGDDDIEWYNGEHAITKEPIKSLMIRAKGVWYNVPLSRGVTEEMLNNPDVLLNCKFRTGWLSVKVDDGNGNMVPQVNAEGEIVLNKEKPYMSFGKPEGIVFLDERRERVFESVKTTADDLGADAAIKTPPPVKSV